MKLLRRVRLCYTMDCSLPGSSVHGIFQARILEWVAISFSRGSSWPRDQTWVSLIVGRCFTVWATREATKDVGGANAKKVYLPMQETRDAGSIPGSERCPGEGNGNPLQYSCLANAMDRGAWWTTVHGVAKSQTQLKQHSICYRRGYLNFKIPTKYIATAIKISICLHLKLS